MSQKNWHKEFKSYMEFIVNHPNYSGLEIKIKENGDYSWIATKTSTIGGSRIAWAKQKAHMMNIPLDSESLYAKVMFNIHPTKLKPCQICGKEMSLYYIYPNQRLKEKIINEFNLEIDTFDTIYDIVNNLKDSNVNENEIKEFLLSAFSFKPHVDIHISIDELLILLEQKCRNGNCKLLGPGAMSNFPDRYDGFHTYNRCCRQKHDKGRHKENMKTYSKDRRAYENWSDGNIHAANKFMHSQHFNNLSADHIGPISLGFIHDPRFLQPMSSGDNSAKRDRLSLSDFKKLKQLEQKYSCVPVSWFAVEIWNDMKINADESNLDKYRDLLKKNMINFMQLLSIIISDNGQYQGCRGKEFLTYFYLDPKMEYFKYSYVFEPTGEYTTQNRRQTDATKKEYERFVRISLSSVLDYQAKDNRKIKPSDFPELEHNINKLLLNIQNKPTDEDNKNLFEYIVKAQQQNLLK